MKPYRNKYYKRRNSRRSRINRKGKLGQSKGFWVFIFSWFAFLGFVYFLLFSPVFKLRQIGFSQTEGVDNAVLEGLVRQELASRFLWVLPRDSYFLFRSNRIKKQALILFPVLRTVQVKKNFPNGLGLSVEKRVPLALWCFEKEQCFLIDQERIVFQQTPLKIGSPTRQALIEFSDLLLVFSNKPPVAVLSEACSKAEMEQIAAIAVFLKGKLNISPESFTFQAENFLNVKTTQGWQIFFDLSLDLKLCLTKLQLLLEKEISKEQLKTLEYIDLRFSKTYYKESD